MTKNTVWARFEVDVDSKWSLYADRFFTFYSDPNIWLVDVHSQERKCFQIDFNSCKLPCYFDKFPHTLERTILQVDDYTVVIIEYSENNTNAWKGVIVLKLDYKNWVAYVERNYKFTRELNSVFLLRFAHSTASFGSYTNDNRSGYKFASVIYIYTITDSEMKIKRIELRPDGLQVIGHNNGYLFGFSSVDGGEQLRNRECDLRKLIQINEDTNEQTELVLQMCDMTIGNDGGRSHEMVLVGKTLVLQRSYYKNYDSFVCFFILNLDVLKWQKMEMKFQPTTHFFITDYDNILFVKTRQANYGKCMDTYYRFVVNRPVTLFDLCLVATKSNDFNCLS